MQDDEKQQYGLNITFKIKYHFKKQPDSNWENDVILGDLYEML
ncbi:hypothetical protein PRO82_002287 [Candidatus Protochlamydia amoebophila]|nr:hypothetical protein [Candidatus Protochlamydia amoebophila]